MLRKTSHFNRVATTLIYFGKKCLSLLVSLRLCQVWVDRVVYVEDRQERQGTFFCSPSYLVSYIKRPLKGFSLSNFQYFHKFKSQPPSSVRLGFDYIAWMFFITPSNNYVIYLFYGDHSQVRSHCLRCSELITCCHLQYSTVSWKATRYSRKQSSTMRIQSMQLEQSTASSKDDQDGRTSCRQDHPSRCCRNSENQ